MKSAAFGWCNRRPLLPPKTCSVCGGPFRITRPNNSAVYACPKCDMIGGGKRGRVRT